MAVAGTYRSVCGYLLHCHLDVAGSARWEIEDDDGARRPVELAPTARPALLSDDPEWPCRALRLSEALLRPD